MSAHNGKTDIKDKDSINSIEIDLMVVQYWFVHQAKGIRELPKFNEQN